MHVHIESETSKDAQLKRYVQNEADVAFQSTVYAKRTLMAGFTTVRDCGGSGVNISLRNAINQGTVIGPRVFTAGKSIASTGGQLTYQWFSQGINGRPWAKGRCNQ